MLLLSFDDFFSKLTFFRNTIRESNDMDPDLGLGLNCLQRLSEDDKSHPWQGKSYVAEWKIVRIMISWLLF